MCLTKCLSELRSLWNCNDDDVLKRHSCKRKTVAREFQLLKVIITDIIVKAHLIQTIIQKISGNHYSSSYIAKRPAILKY